MQNKNIIFELYRDQRTVFSLQEIAMIIGEPDFDRLKRRINYYVSRNKLKNLRRGIYAKEGYDVEELACKIFKPSYISLEKVLQKNGVVFQYNPNITMVSYLSRSIEIDNHNFVYRKIKNEVLCDATGINMNNGISMADPERAFLDTLYLNKTYYFDSLGSLNKETIYKMLPIYHSGQLAKRVQKILTNA